MFSWFKRKPEAKDLAKQLVAVVTSGTPDSAPFEGVDGPALRLHLMCAYAFAVDFGLYQALGNTPRKQEVASAFWAELAMDPLAGGLVAKEAMERLPAFAEAISNPGPMGMSYAVAKMVASGCGSPDDPRVVLLTARMFVPAVTETKRILTQ